MAPKSLKKIQVRYFALLREERGVSEETVSTSARSLKELYFSLKEKHGFSLATDILKVAVNQEFKDWSASLHDGDCVVFIPPVAGG